MKPSTYDFCRDPDNVASSLASVLRMRRAALQVRIEEGAAWTIAERIAFAHVLETIDRWIYDARSWFAVRGLPCPRDLGAGRSPASTEGASMAQGCAALASAVGPAPAAATADITPPC